MHRWALRETADKLVQELFGADLEVERVAAVLDTDIEELFTGELWVECGGVALSYTERK
jgi:hypothetical protein